MITGFVNGQRLKLGAPVIAADTIDYLTAQFVFQTADWLGLEVWSHWQNGAQVYDIPLEDGRITEAAHLNLGAGSWNVWLHGNRYADGAVVQRVTTEKARVEVVPTGSLDGEPFPEIPASVAEQILARLEEIEESGAGGTVVAQVYMRVADGYIQYSTDSAVWENIIAVEDLRGEPGKSPVITLNRFDAVPGAYEGGVSVMVTNADGSFYYAQIYDGSNGSDGTLGAPGADGDTPYIGENGNWWVGETDTGVPAQGAPGADYVLTAADKTEIAQIAVGLLPKYAGEVENA